METDTLPSPAAAVAPGPVLAAGAELLGEYQDSAFETARYLVRRGDGQVMQLPALLYQVAGALDGRSVDDVAADLSRALGEELTGEQVSFLVDDRLRPVGLIAAVTPDGSAAAEPAPPAELVRSDPLLGLRHRVGVIPASAAWRLAGTFAWLFRRAVWIVLLGAFVAVDVAVVVRGDLLGSAAAGLTSVIETPALLLGIVGITIISGAFHECGHIAACRYGGARPGDVGIGLYLVWPTLYSTVTDSYRLDRVGRLRTDLGGVYFDAIFLAGLGALYLHTGEPWLFLALLGMHGEAASQFLPSLRLDGYYILADLVGVPDLFGYVKPAVLSILPGRPVHPKVRELKPRARRLVLLWVALVVPTLAAYLVVVILALPTLLPVAWEASLDYLRGLDGAARAGDVVTTSLAVVQLFLLVLPWVGGVLGVWTVVGLLRRRVAQRRGGDGGPRGPSAARYLVRRATWPVVLVVMGTALVARVAHVARTLPSTPEETRLVAGAFAEVHAGSPTPAAGFGDVLVGEQLVAYARLTGALDRSGTALAAGRELAVVACGLMVVALLASVALRRLRPAAAALPLLAVLVMGPAVATLATLGPAVVGTAWCAVGLLLLTVVPGRVSAALGLLSVALGVATEPVTVVPLAVGIAATLLRARTSPAGRHARPGQRVPTRERWLQVAVVLPVGVLAVVLVASGGTAAPPGDPGRTLLLLLGGVVAVAGFLMRHLRPVSLAAAAAVTVAALPVHGGDVAVLALVTLVLLGTLMIDAIGRMPTPDRPNPLLRATVAVPVLVFVVVGALFAPGSAAPLPHPQLAAWIVGPSSGVGTVVVPAELWADLVRDGVPPARLAEPGSAAATGAPWSVEIGMPDGDEEPVVSFGAGAATVMVRAAPVPGARTAAQTAPDHGP